MNFIYNLIAQFGAGPKGPDGVPTGGLFGFDWGEVIAAVVTLVTSAFGGWWLYRSKRTASDEEQRSKFSEMLLTEYDKLRDLYLSLQVELTKVHNEVYILRNKLEFYEENRLASDAREILVQVINSNENPKWIHSLGTNQWYLNDAYCKTFGVTRSNFWLPVNVLARFNEEDTVRYLQNDLSTVAANTSLCFEEKARKQIMNPKCTEYYILTVKKTPFKINDYSYIIGEVVEIKDENSADKNLEGEE